MYFYLVVEFILLTIGKRKYIITWVCMVASNNQLQDILYNRYWKSQGNQKVTLCTTHKKMSNIQRISYILIGQILCSRKVNTPHGL